MSDTPQEVFQRHVASILDGDPDAVAADYSTDALVLTPTGQYRGVEQIRGLYAQMGQALPEVALEARVTAFARRRPAVALDRRFRPAQRSRRRRHLRLPGRQDSVADHLLHAGT